MKKENKPTKYVTKVGEPMGHEIIMSLLKFDTIELISCVITVKILESWINVCTLKTILVICKYNIFSLIREISIRNGLEKSLMIVQGISWNEIHKIGIVEKLIS
jgi:hypothetical protein